MKNLIVRLSLLLVVCLATFSASAQDVVGKWKINADAKNYGIMELCSDGSMTMLMSFAETHKIKKYTITQYMSYTYGGKWELKDKKLYLTLSPSSLKISDYDVKVIGGTAAQNASVREECLPEAEENARNGLYDLKENMYPNVEYTVLSCTPQILKISTVDKQVSTYKRVK